MNQGAARDAMIVLLEAPCIPNTMKALANQTVVELLTFAVSLGVQHWRSEVTSLDESRFTGDCEDDLHAIVVDYELRTCCVSARPADATLERLVDRDLQRCQAEKPRRIRTFRLLLEKVVASGQFASVVIRDWLLHVSAASGQYTMSDVCEAIGKLIDGGELMLSNAMFRSVVKLDKPEQHKELLATMANGRFLHGRDCTNLLTRPDFLADNFAPWGDTAFELLAALIQARQKSDWPYNVLFIQSLMKDLEEPSYGHDCFTVNYEQDARLTTIRQRHDEEHPVFEIAIAIDKAAIAFLRESTDSRFQVQMRKCIDVKFTAIISIPLLALLDRLNSSASQTWHLDQAMRLLSLPDVLESSSLHDSRRLLRMSVLTKSTTEQTEQLLYDVRNAVISDESRLCELSDFDESHLSASEREQIFNAESFLLSAVSDPRENPLIRTGRAFNVPAKPQPRTGPIQ